MARARRRDRARSGPFSAFVLVAVAGAVRLAQAELSQNGAAAWLTGYRAPAACPDERAFSSAVERRRTGPAAAGDARVRVRVEIARAPEPDTYSGVIEVSEGPERTRREVAGGACAEVAEALSLIAAMGLDAGASSGATESGPSAAAPPAPPDAAAPGSPLDQPQSAAHAAAPLGADAREDLVFGLGALAVAHGAAAPGAALGMGGALALEWRAGSWQPALSLSAFRASGGDVQLAGGAAHARFELLAGAAQLCPLRFPLHGRWALRPCLELELGQLSGTSSGSAVRGATTRSGLWSSGGLGVRGDADVWGPLRVSAGVAAVVPFGRHEYTFSPGTTTAFQVPALDWRATGLVGVFF